MAFHVACPLTCRKICDCSFGESKLSQNCEGKRKSVEIAAAFVAFWGSRDLGFEGEQVVDVLVPCLPKDVKKNKQKIAGGHGGGRESAADDGTPTGSRRAVSHRKMAVSSIAVAEATSVKEKARKGADSAKAGGAVLPTEASDITRKGLKNGSAKGGGGEGVEGGHGKARLGAEHARNVEESAQTTLPRAVCGLCASGEVIGREREKRMLSCHGCAKKFHRNCVKKWAEFRDLFNWASWVCPSCRSCEVCRRTREADKLTFCKRCDASLHVYCQQPPLKHVPKGPYLCPKHTHCHSCSSNVPGSGVSSRWFMSYTNCDACGRLFVKDKYCPVCLKVYRDSEMTPMVCCDSCEHWVHCRCDGISDEKFIQFQHDDNLRYKCAACRGDCHKVNGIDDAVRELWRRRDESEADQRAKLYAAAKLPSREEMRKLCPSSDDENPQVFASQASGQASRAFDSRIKIGKKRKKEAVLTGSVRERQETNVRKQMVIHRSNTKPSAVAGSPRTPSLVIQSTKLFKGKDITPTWYHKEGPGRSQNVPIKGSQGFPFRGQTEEILVESIRQSDREKGTRDNSWYGKGSNVAVEVELLNGEHVQDPLKRNRVFIPGKRTHL